jgi:hypothetical protein
MPATLFTGGYEQWLGRSVKRTSQGWLVMPTISTVSNTNYWSWASATNTTGTTQMVWIRKGQTYAPTWSDIYEAHAYEQDRWVTDDADDGPLYQTASQRTQERLATPYINRGVRPSQTPEQIAQYELRLQEHQERERERKVANKRAEELLLTHLTPEQQKTYRDNKWFVVQGGKSGKLYRINCHGSFVGNVDVLESDKYSKPTHRLCAHLNHVPNGDNWLAQKALLEWDEEHFVKTANIHRAA